MIRSLWIENASGDRLDIDLRESSNQLGFTVFNLDGLGSPKATINGQGGPNFDGIRANSIQVDARQIVMTLAVTGIADREEAAKALIYQFFPLKQMIKFGVITDSYDVYIDAYVEQNEFNQFSQVENAVISLYCPQPYFRQTSETLYTAGLDSSTGLFSFPFVNEGGSPVLEFGAYVPDFTIEIPYYGGAPTGCYITLQCGYEGQVTDIDIKNSNGNQVMRLSPKSPAGVPGSVYGDTYFIDTRAGQKSVTVLRSGFIFNVISDIRIGDDWLTIEPGNNVITIEAESGIENILFFDVRFHKLREGV